MRRAVLRVAGRVWRDPRFKDLYRSGKEFELMHRALGFAALALLTVIPLLLVVAAANPAPYNGLAGWVVYGMGLTGSRGGHGRGGRACGSSPALSSIRSSHGEQGGAPE